MVETTNDSNTADTIDNSNLTDNQPYFTVEDTTNNDNYTINPVPSNNTTDNNPPTSHHVTPSHPRQLNISTFATQNAQGLRQQPYNNNGNLLRNSPHDYTQYEHPIASMKDKCLDVYFIQ
jgi:hypothetical protein